MTKKDKKAEEKPSELDPKLKDFIDRAIVPILVGEWLDEEQTRRSRALPSDPQTSESTKEITKVLADSQ